MLHCLFWALIKHRQQHITNRFTALLYQQHYSTNNHNSSASTALQHTPITCKAMWGTNHHQVQHHITPCIIRNKSSSNRKHSAQQSIIINTKHSAHQLSIKYKAHHATNQYQIQSAARNTASGNTNHSAHQFTVHFDWVTARSIRDSIVSRTCAHHQHRFFMQHHY